MSQAAADKSTLKQRLEMLRGHFSQAEIARKTGFSRNNISRYMRGRRMPLDFGTALASGLGVNPVWLLLGNGSPFLADVAADTGRMAGDLLELVHAMQAVTRMRVGSLAGKQHARMLQELNDALLLHESLRGKLNERSRAIFTQLLSDLRAALARRDLRAAADLVKAAGQVSRLSEDEELKLEHTALEANVLFLQRRPEEALRLQRRVFMGTLSHAESFSERGCTQVVGFALTLAEHARSEESLRVLQAGIALCDKPLRRTSAFADLAFAYGHMVSTRRNLHRGLATMQRHLPRTGDRGRKAAKAFVVRAQVFANVLDVAEACRVMPAFDFGGFMLVRLACLFEDAAALQEALAFLRRLQAKSDLDTYAEAHATNLMAALGGGKGRAEAVKYLHTRKPAPGQRGMHDVVPYAYFAQLAKVLGENTLAGELAAEAHDCIGKFPRYGQVESVIAPITYRTVVELPASSVPAGLRRAAQDYLGFYARRGFCSLEPFVIK
ncbi:MAG: helix-turn-helix transcriptional regulator [Planctomycetes bacterium]|nr:helix-turn-helix transcriptional regulator [Planctomycetota bacterium]